MKDCEGFPCTFLLNNFILLLKDLLKQKGILKTMAGKNGMTWNLECQKEVPTFFYPMNFKVTFLIEHFLYVLQIILAKRITFNFSFNK